jgi:hypothetical protein
MRWEGSEKQNRGLIETSSRHLHGETEENRDESQSQEPVSR